MTTVPVVREHIDAIVVCLANQQLQVGLGAQPRDTDGVPLDAPYIAVHLLDGGSHSGPVADPEADVEIAYQLTCVGRTADEAVWLRDLAVAAVRTTPIVVPDRTVLWSRSDGGPGGTRRDTVDQQTVHYCTPRFRLATTPT